MTARRRSPQDVGDELWDLIGNFGGEGMPREIALDKMTESQFEIAKAWDRDNRCIAEHECLVYLYSLYMRTKDPRLALLAVVRELALMRKRAVRLHRSAIAPLDPADRQSPQIIVASQAVDGILRSTKRMSDAGFSVDLALRGEGPPE
ncbi:hypothetical protein [Streptomyces sp. ISL-100]|uniref:hypothetical protein n=1 Tax=Streptomyces sp. ISL-100 TaxID=2819173 RepID=UPI001BE8997B|nr:hypothetical protein [Streptomyces sp. ISL-100]MBT2401125.1 hypothetical protein [Streptomyces sp. ISL-100]